MESLLNIFAITAIIFGFYYIAIRDSSSSRRKSTNLINNLDELVDPKGFYNEIRLEQVSLYQLKFTELLNLVGVDSNESGIADIVDEIDEITIDASKKLKLNPVYLKVMLLQYLYADPIERRIYNREEDWVKIVTKLTLNSEGKSTFFPSAWSIFATCFENINTERN